MGLCDCAAAFLHVRTEVLVFGVICQAMRWGTLLSDVEFWYALDWWTWSELVAATSQARGQWGTRCRRQWHSRIPLPVSYQRWQSSHAQRSLIKTLAVARTQLVTVPLES